MPKFLILCLYLGLLCSAAAQATPPVPQEQLKSNLDQLSGWMGEWHCEGKFAKSGAAISSVVRFSPSLEGRWIEMRQDDLPPNRFHAIEFWGYDDKQSKFIANIFDNFSSTPRQFEASAVNNGTLTFSRSIPGDSAVAAEQFIFENGNNKLKITYQVMRSRSTAWAVGDALTCNRQ